MEIRSSFYRYKVPFRIYLVDIAKRQVYLPQYSQ